VLQRVRGFPLVFPGPLSAFKWLQEKKERESERERERESEREREREREIGRANLHTKILDFGGFDSGTSPFSEPSRI